jgi:O-acetyl-ADP-ribose deacetylase (regulator of RNase III)
MITQIKSDVLLAPVDAIAHQANCFCTMGAGIAKTIKEKFPEVYAADCATTKGDRSKLGSFSYAYVRSPDNPQLRVVINLYAQYAYGRDKRQTSYDALVDSLTSLKEGMIRSQIMTTDSDSTYPPLRSLGIPYKMGCVNGGGDWRIVKTIITSVFDEFYKKANINVFICEF